MTRCKAPDCHYAGGSAAINMDPARELCDVCLLRETLQRLVEAADAFLADQGDEPNDKLFAKVATSGDFRELTAAYTRAVMVLGLKR